MNLMTTAQRINARSSYNVNPKENKVALDGASAGDEKKDGEDESGSDSDGDKEETKMAVRAERKTGKRISAGLSWHSA